MLAYSPAHEPDDLQWFHWFVESGQLEAIFRANLAICTLADITRGSRFNDANIIARAAGTDRWNYLDDNLVPVAHRQGWQVIWVQPTRNPDIKMLFIRCGQHIISFHRVTTRGRAAEHAKHREPLKIVSPGLFPELDPPSREPDPFAVGPIKQEDGTLLCTPEQLDDLVKAEDLHYWMYTYQRTKETFFKWAVMGRPVKDQPDLLYGFDVMRVIGYILPEDQTIDLNDESQTPPEPKFGDPDDKEGNDT